MKASLLGLILCGASGLGSGCASLAELAGELDDPSARVTGAALQGLSLDSATVMFDVEVDNPLAVALPLVHVDLALASADPAPFLLVDLGLERSVPARGKSTVQVPAEIAFAELARTLSGVRPGSVVPYTASIGLAIDVPGLGRRHLPLETSGELPIPTLPRIDVARIVWSDLGVRRASGVLELAIENGNAFGVDLERLDLAVSLAGREVFEGALPGQLTLAGGEGSTLRIPFSLSAIQIAQAGISMLSGDDAGYTIGGEMKLGTRFGPLASRFERSGRAQLRE